MSVRYLETYEFPHSARMGISLASEWMGGRYSDGHKYMLWWNGCGFDKARTIEEAREKIKQYYIADISEKRQQAMTLLDETQEVLFNLLCDMDMYCIAHEAE